MVDIFQGALWGSAASLIIVGIIFTGAQIYTFQGHLKYPSLPFNTEKCEANSTSTIYIADQQINEQIPKIFRINFMYYSFLGSILVAIVGYPISILTGGNKELDEKLLAPVARKLFQRKSNKNSNTSGIELECNK
jgi:sodium-coupled monocarboxylate transporter 8/12